MFPYLFFSLLNGFLATSQDFSTSFGKSLKKSRNIHEKTSIISNSIKFT